MKKSLLLFLAIFTTLFAAQEDIIIVENYIPQDNCKIIKTIKVDDNKSLTKEQIYIKLKTKAKKLDANVILNTTFHNELSNSYISGDASKCDLNVSKLSNISVQSFFKTNKTKYPKNIYTNPLLESIKSNTSYELGLTSGYDGTFYAGLIYSSNEYYIFYSDIIFLHKSSHHDLGYTFGIRQYPFVNTKFKNIRASVNYGIQDISYKNSKITKYNGLNVAIGYAKNKDKGYSIDLVYKALNHSIKNRSGLEHFQLNISYKF